MALPRSSALRLASIWLAYLGLAVLATWPLALRAGDHLFGQGTPPLNVWAMGWVLHQLPRDPAHLFDGNVFYPYRYALAFSEHLFVPSLQAAPVVWLTGNLVLAHNVVVLLTLATAGLGMYLLAREVAGDGAGAFAAGVLYAFHTWNVNEIIRLQILSNQWFPFVLLGLLRFFKRPGWRPALGTAAAYAAQSLSCMYWSLYAPLLVGPAALVLAWRKRTPIRDLVPLVVAFVPAIGLTALFAWPYVANGRTLGFARAVPDSVGIDRYLDVLPGNVLYERLLGTANSNMDAAHFLGVTAMALAIVGAGWGRFRDGESRWPWIALALCGIALGLGPECSRGATISGPDPTRSSTATCRASTASVIPSGSRCSPCSAWARWWRPASRAFPASRRARPGSRSGSRCSSSTSRSRSRSCRSRRATRSRPPITGSAVRTTCGSWPRCPRPST